MPVSKSISDKSQRINYHPISGSFTAFLVEFTSSNRLLAQDKPNSTSINSEIPKCVSYTGNPCYTFAYQPCNDPVVDIIVKQIMRNSNLDHSDVIGLENESKLDRFVNGNIDVQCSYNFYIDYGCLKSTRLVPMVHDQTCNALNHTLDEVTAINYVVGCPSKYKGHHSETILYLPMVYALEKTLLQLFRDFHYDVNFFDMPHKQLEHSSTLDIGNILVFLSVTLITCYQLEEIATDNRIRRLMLLNGLNFSCYWVSNITFNSLVNLVHASMIVTMGRILEYRPFQNTSFWILFTYIYIYLQLILSFCLFIATLLRTSHAKLISIFTFIITTLSTFPTQYIYTSDITVAKYLLLGLPMIPGSIIPIILIYGYKETEFVNLDIIKGINDISSITTFTFMQILLILMFIYWTLALYLDYIVCCNVSPWFVIDSSFWKRKLRLDSLKHSRDCNVFPNPLIPNALELHLQGGLVVENLEKTFITKPLGFIPIGCSKHHVIKNLSFNVEEGKICCLLGINGAGKSTAISIMTGAILKDSGMVSFFNLNIDTHLDQIRRICGFCLQHDLLWENLTPREHLHIFGLIKGMSDSYVESEIKIRLKQVGLQDLSDVPVCKLSGSMKRRISLAIAFMGKPKVIFLDEPTTGMDLVSRLYIWDMISKAKKESCILLTSHIMEEVAILSDFVVIINSGSLVASGSPAELQLKLLVFATLYITAPSRFQSTITQMLNNIIKPDKPTEELTSDCSNTSDVALDVSDSNILEDALSASSPLNSLSSESSESVLTFPIHFKHKKFMHEILETLEMNQVRLGITSIKLKHTGLSDVFLNTLSNLSHDQMPTHEGAPKSNRFTFSKFKPFLFPIAICIALLTLIALMVLISIGINSKFLAATQLNEIPIDSNSTGLLFATPLVITDVSTDTAIVSYHIRKKCVTTLVVSCLNSNQKWVNAHVNVKTTTSDLQVKHIISSLLPNSQYQVYSTQLGLTESKSLTTRFKTPPLLNTDDNRDFYFGIASDFGPINSDKWASLKHVSKFGLDAFLLLGNVVNCHNTSTSKCQQSWINALNEPSFKELIQSTSFISAWADEAFQSNWGNSLDGKDMASFESARESYSQAFPYMQNDNSGSEKKSKLYRKISWGGIFNFFVLDLQSDRMDNRIASNEQIEWLIREINNSEAIINFVLSTSYMSYSPNIDPNDPASWSNYPNEKTKIIKGINPKYYPIFISRGIHSGIVFPKSYLISFCLDPSGNPSPKKSECPFEKKFKFGMTNFFKEIVVSPLGTPVNYVETTMSLFYNSAEVYTNSNAALVMKIQREKRKITVKYISEAGFLINEFSMSF